MNISGREKSVTPGYRAPALSGAEKYLIQQGHFQDAVCPFTTIFAIHGSGIFFACFVNMKELIFAIVKSRPDLICDVSEHAYP
jgi:hypothetical protein